MLLLVCYSRYPIPGILYLVCFACYVPRGVFYLVWGTYTRSWYSSPGMFTWRIVPGMSCAVLCASLLILHQRDIICVVFGIFYLRDAVFLVLLYPAPTMHVAPGVLFLLYDSWYMYCT